MKKCLLLLLTLCLLLTACGGPTEESSAPAVTTTTVPEGVTTHYSSYAVRSMRLRVTSGTDQLERMGEVNNLYDQQAYGVFQTLNTAAYNKSYLSAPTGTPWVRLVFCPHSDTEGETYTVYENDLVVVEHPATGTQAYTAPAGTFYQTVTRLNALRAEQTAHVTLKEYEQGGAAGYTIHYKSGKTKFVSTGTDLPVVDMVGEDLVRVCFRDTVTFYDTATGKTAALTAETTDVAGDYVAAAARDGVDLYRVMSQKSLAHIYAAVEGEGHAPIRGISFSEDGASLHIVGAHNDGVVWDRTLAVVDLLGSTRYYLGAWSSIPAATEKEQQTVGYNLLKKLRHKEKELGHTFSALPQKQLTLDGKLYYLTEIGYWEKVDGKNAYTKLAHLLTNEGLTVAYETTVSENELVWDTTKNWMKK